MKQSSFNIIRLAILGFCVIPVMAVIPAVATQVFSYKSAELATTCVVERQTLQLKEKEGQLISGIKSATPSAQLLSVLATVKTNLAKDHPDFHPRIVFADTPQPLVLGLVTSILIAKGSYESTNLTDQELEAWIVREAYRVIHKDAISTLCKKTPQAQADAQKKGEFRSDASAAAYMVKNHSTTIPLRSLLTKLKALSPDQFNRETNTKPSVDQRMAKLGFN